MSDIPLSRRVILFLGTISPAIILMGLVAFDLKFWRAWVVVAAGLGLLLAPLRLIHEARTLLAKPYDVQELRLATPDLTGFLLSYLLPLVIINYADLEAAIHWVPIVVAVLLIGFIYSAGNLVHVQPIYFMAFYRIYEVKVAGEWHCVLSRGRLHLGRMDFHQLAEGLLVARRAKN